MSQRAGIVFTLLVLRSFCPLRPCAISRGDHLHPLCSGVKSVAFDGIESSAKFASVICRAIDKADVVLFMHSSVHLSIDFENDWTIKELNYAQIKKKRVVLVKLDNAPLDNIFLMEYGSKNNIDSQDPVQVQKLMNDSDFSACSRDHNRCYA